MRPRAVVCPSPQGRVARTQWRAGWGVFSNQHKRRSLSPTPAHAAAFADPPTPGRDKKRAASCTPRATNIAAAALSFRTGGIFMRTRLMIAVVGSIFAFALAPASAQPTPGA